MCAIVAIVEGKQMTLSEVLLILIAIFTGITALLPVFRR